MIASARGVSSTFERSPRDNATILAIVLMLLVLLSGSPESVSAASPTGVIVPLYSASESKWDTVIQAKIAHPTVTIVGIINPGNGSGTSPDTGYATLTQKLQSAGVIVLGYVYTSYGSRNSSVVRTEIDNYASWYKVNGAFLDEMETLSGKESYYKNLTDYAKLKGLTLIVGNAGTETSPGYVGTVDSIVIYESAGLPSTESLGGWHASYDKKNWAILPYAVGSLDRSYVGIASNYVGYIYMTNGTYPHPWGTLPPYFGDLVATLDTTIAQLTVNTKYSADGTSMPGYYTVLYQNGNTVATGFSPTTFTLNSGQLYTIQVQDYGNFVFDRWADTGSTARDRDLSITSYTQITALYRGINAAPAGQSTISVTTVNSSGGEITGYYTSLWQGSTMLQSCFSRCSFSVANEQTYQVAVADYGGKTFTAWSDGTTSRFYSVVVGSTSTTVSLTAVYSP